MGRKLTFCKDQALRAAAQLFCAKGYEKTAMRDVTEAMGIPVASLYHSFGDKHALLLAVLEYYFEQKMKPGMLALVDAPNHYEAIHQFFIQMVRAAKSCEGRAGCITLHAASELGDEVPEAASFAKKSLAYAKEQFAAAILLGQKSGTIARSQNAEFLSAYLIATMIAVNAWLRMDASELQLCKYIDQAMQIIDGRS